MDTPCVFAIEYNIGSYTIPYEVIPIKFLNINTGLSENQQEQFLKVLRIQAGAFTWEYCDMKGICLDTYIHHIYMDSSISPIRKPRRRMNPSLKDIVKEDYKKSLMLVSSTQFQTVNGYLL